MRNFAENENQAWPACVGVDEAAQIFGWPSYFFPVLMRTGHLKPLGKPSQNARKWFATVELLRLSQDAAWLDKAIRVVEKHVQDNNYKQRNRAGDDANASKDELQERRS